MKNEMPQLDWEAILKEALNAPAHLGNTFNRFYRYSFINTIMLMIQGCSGPVATYRKWTELGRQVRKGSKAKWVFAPIIVNKTKDGKPVMRDGKPEKVLVGFRQSNSIFEMADTDGGEIEVTTTVPGFDIEKVLADNNIERVPFAMIDGNCQGYSFQVDDKKCVAINDVAQYPLHTMIHEVAHLLLGHCKQTDDDRPCARGGMEFEAESTAYIVLSQLGETNWNAAESRAYIDHWLTDAHVEVNEDGERIVNEKLVRRVFKVVEKILSSGRVDDGEVAA